MDNIFINENIKTALIVGVQKDETQSRINLDLLELETLLKTLQIFTKHKLDNNSENV